MDDKADYPQQLRAEPLDERTGPPGARPAVGRPAMPDHVQALQTRPIGQPIEPVFAAPAAKSAPPESMFGVSPSEILGTPQVPPKLAPAGFFPPGTGLLPVGLLPPGPNAPPAFEVQEPGALRPSPPNLDRPAAVAPRPAPPAAAASSSLGWYARKTIMALVYLAAGWALLTAVLVVVYRFADPPLSALMLQRFLSGDQINKTWVPIDAMSPSLVRAVLVSEDGRFCQHAGIDLDAMQTAIERAGNGTPRGASTISMQVVKNLFLWPSKSYLRKVLEVPVTLAIETLWSKRRIMEIYLNIAEWAPGVFGAEAAARYHFSKSAHELTDREAALLAVTLPNPFRRDAGKPGPGTRRLAGLIQARSRSAGGYQTACVLVPFKRK